MTSLMSGSLYHLSRTVQVRPFTPMASARRTVASFAADLRSFRAISISFSRAVSSLSRSFCSWVQPLLSPFFSRQGAAAYRGVRAAVASSKPFLRAV